MNHIDEFRNWIKIGFFVLIGIFIGFMLWHPMNNNYVSKVNYDLLQKDYNSCLAENEDLKQSMSNLIIELYTKQVAFDLMGFKKHRLVFCTLQKHLTGEIPIIGELIC